MHLLSFFKKIFLSIKKIYYSGFNRKILSRINENEDVFEKILQFPRRSKKFTSKVFASEESLNCFKLFLKAHKKDEKKYNKDDIKNIFIDLDISKEQTKLIKLLLDNDIHIYSSNPNVLSIKSILRTDIDVKNYKLLKELLSSCKKDEKIKETDVQRIFSICNVPNKMKCGDLGKIKENLKFIDFLSGCSVNDENINKIFSYNDIVFNKMEDESNRELFAKSNYL